MSAYDASRPGEPPYQREHYSKPPLDYRELLKKYMRHVVAEESVDYLSAIIPSDGPGRISSDELAELEKLAEELD